MAAARSRDLLRTPLRPHPGEKVKNRPYEGASHQTPLFHTLAKKSQKDNTNSRDHGGTSENKNVTDVEATDAVTGSSVHG